MTGKYANQSISQFLSEDGAIHDVRNGVGPGLALMSVRPWKNDAGQALPGEITTVDLTIGAMQDDFAAGAFNKTTLLALASWLIQIADAMASPKRDQ